MIGHIHSIETFGTVDGPGIRFVAFMQGCPLRCQGSYTGGDHRSGDIALPIAAQPPEIAVGVAVRPGQTHAAGRGESFTVPHNDIHRACGIANAAAV